MRAELGLPSVKGDDEHGGGMTGGFGGSMGGAGQTGKGKRPINVKFEIPYFTTSGIQVRYLKIIEPKVSHPTFLPRSPHIFLFSPPSSIFGLVRPVPALDFV
jgi:AP-1 complex subunit mu